MIHGIGIDLIEIDRIKDVYIKQSDKLIHRILTEQEQQKFNSFKNDKRKLEFLADDLQLKKHLVKH